MTVEPNFVYREPLKEEYPRVGKFSDEMVRCIKCGLCRAVCPTLLETLSESQGARGRVALVEAVLDGRLSLSDIFDDRISGCINCKACIEACPSGVRVDDIILAARAELVSRGRLPFLKRIILRGLLKRGRLLPPVGKLASLMQRIVLALSPKGSALRLLLPLVRIDKERRLPVFAPKSFREQFPERIAPLGGEAGLRVVYFVGCACNLIYTDIANATMEVLKKLGVEVIIPREQGCCGTPMFNAGDFDTARRMAQLNMTAMDRSDTDAIVVACASCGLALKREYSRILELDTAEFSERVMDISEFIVKKIGVAALRSLLATPTGEEVVVTYHDPCHLKRGQDIREEPREIIRNIPGVKFEEMSEPDRCCGGGGLYSFTHYEMSASIAAHKVEAIKESKAQIVLTSCPSCIMQLKDTLSRASLDVKVMHVVEFLAEALNGRTVGATRGNEKRKAVNRG
jgi:glycolate oxidase iron-sulfur subunit